MKKLLKKIEEIILKAEEKKINPLVWIGGFFGIIAVRLFFDNFLAKTGKVTVGNPTDVHNLLFFLLAIVFLWIFLVLLIKEKPFKLSKIMLWGSLAIILPPILDMLKTGGGTFWSPYLFSDTKALQSQFMSFFGNLPTGMLYFGTRILALLAVLGVFMLVFVKTKHFLKAIFGGILAYVILFFMVSLPSLIAYLYYFLQESKKVSEISSVDIVQLVASIKPIFGLNFAESLSHIVSFNLNLIYFPVLCLALSALFLLENKPKFVALIKNARLPQIIGHIGFFAVGIGLGFLAYPERFELGLFPVFAVFDLILAIILAWVASVIVNDVYDFEVDKISNSVRPLPKGIFETKEYLNLGIIIFLLSLLGGLVVSPKFAALLFVYQFIAWAYSSEPFRLKNFPIIATLLGAVDLILVMMMGFTLISGDNNIQGLSWRVILYLLIFLTFFLPIKDFKDIEADKKYQTWTLPVIFGEETGRMLLAIWAFVSFVASVFFLNEYRLFWWAILFGSVMFFILINKKIKPRQFFWWALIIIGGYGLVLVKTLFL